MNGVDFDNSLISLYDEWGKLNRNVFVHIVVYIFSIQPRGLSKISVSQHRVCDSQTSSTWTSSIWTSIVTNTEHIAHFTSASCQNMPNVELKDLILFFVIFVAFVANCIFVCAFIYFKRIMSPPPMDQSEM